MNRSEAEIFYEGFLEALAIFERARDIAKASYGETDAAYRILNAVIHNDLRDFGKAAAQAAYPFYDEPAPARKIPLELKG